MTTYIIRQQLILLVNDMINSIEKHLKEIRTITNHLTRDMMSDDYQFFYKKLAELKIYRMTIDIRPLTMEELDRIEQNPLNNIKYYYELSYIGTVLDKHKSDKIEDFNMHTCEDMNKYLLSL